MTQPATASPADPRHQALLLRACRREPVERTPVWLMRQAGRYLPEYRAIRAKVGFLELCKTPRLSAEVMIATVDRLGVDAAIIFSDLLPLLEPLGLELEFTAGEGPVIHNPVREPGDLARIAELADVDQVGFVMETVAATRAGLPDSIIARAKEILGNLEKSELNTEGQPALAKSSRKRLTPDPAASAQLSLL